MTIVPASSKTIRPSGLVPRPSISRKDESEAITVACSQPPIKPALADARVLQRKVRNEKHDGLSADDFAVRIGLL